MKQIILSITTGELRWNEMTICENLRRGERNIGLFINERTDIVNNVIKKTHTTRRCFTEMHQVEEVG
jgi:hypothetical protein